MKKKVMFVYEFEKRTKSLVTQTNRKLFGYLDRSNHGKYLYPRKGLLSNFHIERITKGVFLTDEINDKKVLELLHSVGTKKIKRYYLDIEKIIG